MIQTELAPAGIRIRRRCPSCGAPVEHSETDTAVACAYCQIHLAVLGRETVPRYAVPARLDPAAARLEASRYLRGRETRVRRLGAPLVTYVPFARLRATVYSCWRDAAGPPPEELQSPRRGASLAKLGLQLGLGLAPTALRSFRNEARRPLGGSSAGAFQASDFRFRAGAWEQTICGAPSLGWGDSSLGVRTQALSVTPLDELLPADLASLELPARVGPEISVDAARAQLEKRLAQAHDGEPGSRDAARWFAIRRELQWIYWPYVTLEFEGPATRGQVILDGVTLHARLAREESEEATEHAGATHGPTCFEAHAGDTAGWTFAPPDAGFISLICPNCSMPLPFRAVAQLFPCSNCHRLWRAEERRLVESRGIVLRAPNASRALAGRDEVALPFYRVTSGAGGKPEVCFVPAAECRHPRALWNLASALSRRADIWEEEEPERGLDIAVVLRPDEANALLPFARACATEDCALATASSSDTRVELVWLRVARSAGAWVEPRSGLSVPEAALIPWSET